MLLLVVALLTPGLRAQVDTETRARAFLEKFSTEASVKMYDYSLASWAYNTDITEENSNILVRGRLRSQPPPATLKLQLELIQDV